VNRFTRRLEALEARAPRCEDVLVLTKGMTDAECAVAYGRIRAGEPLESIFPGAQFEPDPEPNLISDAVEGMTLREVTNLYLRLLRCGNNREAFRQTLREQIARNRSCRQ
jgi:hypothetical protein